MSRGLEQIPWLYDVLFWFLERLTPIGPWRRALVAGARGRVLDIGCGTGRNLPLFRAELTVVGVDIQLESLLAARRRAPGTALVRASAEALPFRAGSFDTVVSGLVFCSVPRPEIAFAELARALKDDGELRMLEHVRARVRWLAWLQDRMQPWWTRLMGGCHPNRETEQAVEAAGFRIASADRAAAPVLRRFRATKDTV